MDLNTKVKRSAICAGVSVVRSARLGLFSSFCCAACTAASVRRYVDDTFTILDVSDSYRAITRRHLTSH